MAQILKKMNVLLDRRQKLAMAGLMVLMVIGAFLQTAGVGLLVQVVSVVIDPGAVEKSAMVRGFYDFLGCQDFQSFSNAFLRRWPSCTNPLYRRAIRVSMLPSCTRTSSGLPSA